MAHLKQRLFSAISWRVERRAAALAPAPAYAMRRRCGQLMGLSRAHDALPEIENRAAILCFHSVVAHRRDPDVECDAMPVQEFRKLLAVLKRSFRVIGLAELVEAVREHRLLRPKSVVITFDDGYANNCTTAAGELAAAKMPWSEFLPASLIETQQRQWTDDVRVLIHRGKRRRIELHWEGNDRVFELDSREQREAAAQTIIESCRYEPDEIRRSRVEELYSLHSADEIESLRSRYLSFAPMTWAQARELQSAGVDVGSHGLGHVALGVQSPQCIRRELLAARELLQTRIGSHSPHFSYPYGRGPSVSDQTDAVLAEMGYHCGLTLEADVVECGSAELLRLPRLIVAPQAGRVLYTLWQRFVR